MELNRCKLCKAKECEARDVIKKYKDKEPELTRILEKSCNENCTDFEGEPMLYPNDVKRETGKREIEWLYKRYEIIKREHEPYKPFHYANCPNCGRLLRNNGNGYFRCTTNECGKEFVIYELTDD